MRPWNRILQLTGEKGILSSICERIRDILFVFGGMTDGLEADAEKRSQKKYLACMNLRKYSFLFCLEMRYSTMEKGAFHFSNQVLFGDIKTFLKTLLIHKFSNDIR
ncbi:UNVERIFIED_CONTAM: hypothetical protein NCL1_06132 [Trichonephila clavipes]